MNEYQQKDEITIKEIIFEIAEALRYLKKRILYIVPVCILIAIAGYFLESKKPTFYSANTLFLLQTANPSSGIAASLAKDFGIGSSGAAVNNLTLIEIINSKRSVYNCLFSKYITEKNDTDLIINYFIPLLFDKKTTSFKENFTLADQNPEAILKINTAQKYIIANCLKCVDNDKSSTLSLSCTSTSPQVSKAMCQNLISYLTRFFQSNIDIQKRQNNNNLLKRIDSLQYELQKREITLGKMKDGNVNLVKSIALIKFNELNRDISTLNEQLIQYKNSYEALNNNITKSQDFLQIIDYPEDYSIEMSTPNPITFAVKIFIFSLVIISILIIILKSVKAMTSSLTK